MINKVREISVPTISYLNDVKGGDVSENQDVQRRFCSDNSFINGIGVTILTGDYLPPIILGEIPVGQGMVQQYIVDAMQRTSALMKIRFGNYKFSSATEDSEIEYQTKKRDKDGTICLDKEGNIIWEQKVFNIKNRTFDNFPEELKKRFDNFQLRIVVHENCTMERISKLIRKYNNHRGMNVSQKAFTYLDLYARRTRAISETPFFKDSIEFSELEKRKGTYEKLVCESVMTVFHLSDWKKQPKQMNIFLNKNSSEAEFDRIQEYAIRLNKICEDKFQDIFIPKNISVWFAVFDRFVKLNVADCLFRDFLIALRKDLHSRNMNGLSYDSLDKESGTKDKKIIVYKIETFSSLLLEYVTGREESILQMPDEQFISECLDLEIHQVREDIIFYNQSLDTLLDYAVRIDSKLRNAENRISLLTMMVYSYKEEVDLEEWLLEYAQKHNTYLPDQKKNYMLMKEDLKKFLEGKDAYPLQNCI